MKAYSAYRDSGIEWLGSIPKHWEVKRFKHIGISRIGLTYDPTEVVQEPSKGTLVLRSSNIQNSKLSLKDTVYVNKEIPEKLKLKRGDIVICSRNGSKRLIGKNICIDENTEGCSFGAFMTTYRTPYWRYSSKIFNSDIFTSQSSLFLTSTINQLTQGTLNNFYIPFPPEEEQTAIANFLDHKTAQIDLSIEKRRELIDLLKEHRAAIINEAVTKGINRDAAMKDSGIEWIGEVPEHWEVKKLKYLSSIKTGEKNTEDKEPDAKYPFFVRSQTVERISSYSYDGEAILTAGDGVGVAKVFHYINGKFDYHQRVYKVSDFREVLGKYFFYYMKVNLHKEVMKLNAKSTVDSLRLPMFRNFPVSFGTEKEQQQIIKYIETETSRIDDEIEATQQEVDLLKEYRQSLIAEAVTGKIDVRDYPLN